MLKENSTRSGCGSVLYTFLVKNATYDSPLEILCMKTKFQKPNKLFLFQKQYTNRL